MDANASGKSYQLSFETSPAVFADHGQATQAGDGLLIEVLSGDKSVLASKTITPGAWAGKLEFQPGVLEYQGDGSGAVKLRISPAKTSSKRFQGAIDNLQWRENK